MRAALAIAAVLAVGVAAAARGQGETLPADQVARVADRPVAKAVFDHWMVIAAASEDIDPVPAPGQPHYVHLRNEVLAVLIRFEWIEAEAALRHVTLSDRAVRRAYRREKRRSFPNEADYQRFLRMSKQTDADIVRRIRLGLLSDRLRARAIGDARTVRGKQRRLERFVRRFTRRWRAQTVCGQGYESRDCARTVPIATATPTPTPTATPRPAETPRPAANPEADSAASAALVVPAGSSARAGAAGMRRTFGRGH